MTDPSKIDFRLPPEAHKRMLKKMLLLQSAGFAVALVWIALTSGLTWFVAISTALALAVIMAIVYFTIRSHVYVALSLSGVSGTGETARSITIPWHEPMTVRSTSKSFIKGVEIRASRDGGFFRSRVSTFFVPEDIVNSPEFQDALRRFAPVGHPLRTSR